MTHPKTKPAAAKTPKSEPSQPTAWQKTDAEAERHFQELQGLARIFVEEFGLHDFTALRTFKLILDRDKGCITPIETFITSLVMHYGNREAEGKGMTLGDVQFQMEQHLTDDDNLARTIKNAHFVAARYPLPESHKTCQ